MLHLRTYVDWTQQKLKLIFLSELKHFQKWTPRFAFNLIFCVQAFKMFPFRRSGVQKMNAWTPERRFCAQSTSLDCPLLSKKVKNREIQMATPPMGCLLDPLWHVVNCFLGYNSREKMATTSQSWPLARCICSTTYIWAFRNGWGS